MPVKKKSETKNKAKKSAKPASGNTSIQKQIDEVRNSAIALFNVLAKKEL